MTEAEIRLASAIAAAGRGLARAMLEELLEPARVVGWAWSRTIQGACTVPAPVIVAARHDGLFRFAEATLSTVPPVPSTHFEELGDAWAPGALHEHPSGTWPGRELFLSWPWPHSHSDRCRGCGWVWDGDREKRAARMASAVAKFVAGGGLGVEAVRAHLEG